MAGDSDSDWKTEYQKRLDSLENSVQHVEHDERRRAHRHTFQHPTQALVTGPPQVYNICDISVGGVSFLAEQNHEVDSRLWLTAGNVVAVEVEVVRVTIEEHDPTFLELAYKIHARFIEETEGYMAFVLFWDRDHVDESKEA